MAEIAQEAGVLDLSNADPVDLETGAAEAAITDDAEGGDQGREEPAREPQAAGEEESRAVQQRDDLIAFMTDPANQGLTIEQAVEALRTGQRPSASPDFSGKRTSVVELFEDGNREAVSSVLGYAEDLVSSLRQEVADLKAQMSGKVSRIESGNAHDRAVRAAGVDATDPSFVEFVSTALKKDKRYQLLGADPAEAGRYAGEEFIRRYGSQDVARRVAGSLNSGGSSRGAAQATQQKVKLPPDASMRAIAAQLSRGRKVI